MYALPGQAGGPGSLPGGLAYALPGEPEGLAQAPAASAGDLPPEPSGRLARVAAELLVSAEASANLVVLRTPAGAAQFLASVLDHSAWPSILGTVAATTPCWSSRGTRRAGRTWPARCCGWPTGAATSDRNIPGTGELREEQ